ncbi:MAG: sodium/solute symporter [Pirellulaceae bacterium]
MLFALAWQDHAVIIVYLVGMIGLGVWLSRRQKSDADYFLGGRRMPWFAVGMSVIASLLSSLTYLSEPGEVWRAGFTNLVGKMLAIPLEVFIVWGLCIPFMMRFRFTSAYEYLEHRFNRTARLLGVVFFIVLVVLWMGFVVLASSRALVTVSGLELWQVIFTVGIVATLYTTLGGLRAVIWTDVVQVLLLVGGGVFVIFYIAFTTGSWLPEWYANMVEHLEASGHNQSITLFSFDPRVRTSLITVATSMCIWHICTHTSNQMTVQRYFSTRDARAARRSFLTGTLFGVGLNLMLSLVGMALLFYYLGEGHPLEEGLNPDVRSDQDLIFPTFAVHRLPPGFGGAILAALLAAAMSSIDSGINSIATVVAVEASRKEKVHHEHVSSARWLTLIGGLFITVAAYGLDFLPGDLGIMDSMPRTFNAVTAPLGGLFLVGIFLPRAGGRAAVVGAICGLLTSIVIGYFHILVGNLVTWKVLSTSQVSEWGLLEESGKYAELSPFWVMPCALLATFLVSLLVSFIDRHDGKSLAGLTWSTRHQPSPLTEKIKE